MPLEDGSVLQEPGYRGGIVYDPQGVDFGPIAAHPTLADAQRSLQEFHDIYHECDFVKPEATNLALEIHFSAHFKRS